VELITRHACIQDSTLDKINLFIEPTAPFANLGDSLCKRLQLLAAASSAYTSMGLSKRILGALRSCGPRHDRPLAMSMQAAIP